MTNKERVFTPLRTIVKPNEETDVYKTQKNDDFSFRRAE